MNKTLEYLEQNRKLGADNGHTVGTFLTRTLTGKAKQYSSSYKSSMQKALDKMVKTGEVKVGKSKLGRVAYYPWTMN